MAINVCVCGKDMEMIVMGVGVDYGYGHVYPGDIWRCPACKNSFVHTIGNAISDTNYDKHHCYIRGTSHRSPDAIGVSIDKIWKG